MSTVDHIVVSLGAHDPVISFLIRRTPMIHWCLTPAGH